MGVHARLDAARQSPRGLHHSLRRGTYGRFLRAFDQKLKAMSAPKSGQRRRGRAEAFDAGHACIFEGLRQFIRPGPGRGFVGSGYERVNQMSERRVSE